MDEFKFKVSGMSCGHCQMTVKKALEQIPGVSKADVDLSNGTASVTADSARVQIEQLMQAVEAVGFQPARLD
ncbi:MAG: heavy-metal-associated domain-containing protein [Dehalococcoidaceae bacterium]|nr:heavy-metal-associated domain-containing protein [Dehalococcoidaceae bacterium]